jgi:hypothetical protein
MRTSFNPQVPAPSPENARGRRGVRIADAKVFIKVVDVGEQSDERVDVGIQIPEPHGEGLCAEVVAIGFLHVAVQVERADKRQLRGNLGGFLKEVRPERARKTTQNQKTEKKAFNQEVLQRYLTAGDGNRTHV